MSAYLKAIIAALLAGSASAGTALEDGTITGPEWLIILGAVVVGFGGTAAIPNAGFVRPDKVDDNEVAYGLAPAAYAGYSDAVGGKSTVTGDKLPKYMATAEGVRRGWEAASRAVLLELRR